jgi:intracellular multiplication protein IcmC
MLDNLIDTDILINIATNLAPVQQLIIGSAYLLGIAFAIKAIVGLKIIGESRSNMGSGHMSIKEPLIYMFVSIVFIFFPTALDIMLTTTFGHSSPLGYTPNDGPNPAIRELFGSGSSFGQSLSTIIQVIGVIAFVRGWVLIARAAAQGQQPGSTGKGLVHVFGGILAMNIVLTLQIINNTLYGTS